MKYPSRTRAQKQPDITLADVEHDSATGKEGIFNVFNDRDASTICIESLNDNCVFNVVKDFYLQNKKQCKIGHININSIRHKFEPFKEVMQENIFDVLAIQETKIDDSFPDSQFAIPRFKLYRQDYKCNQGGIIMYIRNDMPQFRRLDLEQL